MTLTGAHPQDLLNISKNRFQAADGPADVAALRDGVKRARAIAEGSLMAPAIEREIFPGANYSTDADIEEHVYEHVFGELMLIQFSASTLNTGRGPTQDTMRAAPLRWVRTTVRISTISRIRPFYLPSSALRHADEFAVVDGDFRVRGVTNLRVVDMSIWPVVPGFFPTTPMYMVRPDRRQCFTPF